MPLQSELSPQLRLQNNPGENMETFFAFALSMSVSSQAQLGSSKEAQTNIEK